MPGETTLGQAWAELRWTQILPDFDATKAAITAEAGQIARAASDAAGGAAPSEDALLRWDRYSVMVRAASQAAMTGRLPFEYLFMVMREGKQIAAELSERGISPLVNSLGGFLSKLGPIGWGAAGLGAVFLMISSAANRAAEALRESEAALEKWEIEQSKVRREVWDIANPRQRPGSEKTQGDVATIEKALADTRTKLMELGKKPKEFVPGPGKPFESQMEQKKRLDRNRKIRELLKDEADFSAALRRGTAKGVPSPIRNRGSLTAMRSHRGSRRSRNGLLWLRT